MWIQSRVLCILIHISIINNNSLVLIDRRDLIAKSEYLSFKILLKTEEAVWDWDIPSQQIMRPKLIKLRVQLKSWLLHSSVLVIQLRRTQTQQTPILV
jgi:hypothetical protein